MNFSEYRLILSAGRTRSVNECTDPLPIPKDLVIEIFSRLPAKSVARYRFLSDFWSFVIHSQYFLDLFTAKSSARPQILFAHINKSGFSFFSAHQPSENSSDNLVPTHLTHGPIYGRVSRPINGLVCISGFNDGSESIICNPSTEEFLSLPKIRRRGGYPNMRNFLGYDPTNKQFKVLSLKYSLESDWADSIERPEIYLQHHVLTLENNDEELSWRKIECYKHHYPIGGSEICINGVLYYHAIGLSRVQLIVCFDFRSETFRFMIVKEIFKKNLHLKTVFTNYNGKLGLLAPEESNNLMTGESLGFEIWILEEEEWLKHVYVLPPIWKDVVGDTKLRFVGMIGTNGIILSSSYRHFGYVEVHPYIFFYNIEKNTIRRVDIQGMKASGLNKAYMFLNHVEGLFFDLL